MDVLRRISSCIDRGLFTEAKGLCDQLRAKLYARDKWTEDHYKALFNLAGFYIDIGHMSGDRESSIIGLQMMEDNEDRLVEVTDPASFYYNLGNGKSNLLNIKSTFDLSFDNIEELVVVKNCFWRAEKEARRGEVRYELMVNLANSLKRQFRFSEALHYYDIVNRPAT